MEKEIFELLKKMDAKIDKIETEVKYIKTQVSENTQILKSLEHSAQVNKAEHDNFSNTLHHLSGDITKIKSDISTMKKDMNNVEIITATNWHEIALLKSKNQ